MEPAPLFPGIESPAPQFEATGVFDALIQYGPVKALLPVPVIILVAPLVWLLFRKTWREIDEEAQQLATSEATDSGQHGSLDYRAIVCLILLALTLTIQDYYGGRSFFGDSVLPALEMMEASGHEWIKLETYGDLWSHSWWAFTRIAGYTIVPILVWKILFRHDSILDMGLRTKGFVSHLWIYALCLVVVVGAMALLSNQKDFLEYYPFYKLAHRSWFDLLVWESAYLLQFFALEFYFRGWMLSALKRRMGSTAIFAMAVPYCMIHYGKPYLEVHGAIIAGVVLGSLAMRTRSIYAGFLVHITVAGLMDYFALMSREGLPTKFWPG